MSHLLNTKSKKKKETRGTKIKDTTPGSKVYSEAQSIEPLQTPA